MCAALKKHWPEYLMEAAGLGLFMVSACGFGALLEHPASPVRQAIDSAFVRRVLMGLAMGLTAIALVYSPWGKQSGAHLNPSFTLTFYRLGKVKGHDAFFYIIAQFAGGLAGVLLMSLVLGMRLAHPNVNYVVTVPGAGGIALAFVAESLITFILMSVVLLVSNHARHAPRTGLCAGALIAAYITFEAPFSGMSMNPARTLGSALPAQVWTAWWIYFTAPLLGMLTAAQVYLMTKGSPPRACAKLHHQNVKRCIFCGKPPG